MTENKSNDADKIHSVAEHEDWSAAVKITQFGQSAAANNDPDQKNKSDPPKLPERGAVKVKLGNQIFNRSFGLFRLAHFLPVAFLLN